MYILKVENLRVTLKESGALLSPGVSFTLERGGATAIVGESGSGKTMCVGAILGLLNRRLFAVSGRVNYIGRDLLSLSERRLRGIRGGKIALIPQNPMTAFDPSAKIGAQMTETIRVHAAYSRQAACARAVSGLTMLGLPREIMAAYPHTLSGGMLQRVAIALALLMKPDFVIADEATTALDVINRKIVLNELIKLKSDGAALLLITHNANEADYCGCRIARIGETRGGAHDD
jgi:ABC-type glutathione transport system ATPase component